MIEQLVEKLGASLAAWLVDQPWFAAGGLGIAAARPIGFKVVRRSWPILVLAEVEVELGDGSLRMVHLALGIQSQVRDEVPDSAIIGEIDLPGQGAMVIDALADPQLAVQLARIAAPGLPSTRASRPVSSAWSTTVVIDSRWSLQLDHCADAAVEPVEPADVDQAMSGEVWIRSQFAAAGAPAVSAQFVAPLKECAVLSMTPRSSAMRTSRQLLVDVVGPQLRGQRSPDWARAVAGGHFTEVGRRLGELHLASGKIWGVGRLGAGRLVGAARDQLTAAGVMAEVAQDCIWQIDRLHLSEDLGSELRLHGNLRLSNIESARGYITFARFGVGAETTRIGSPMSDMASLVADIRSTSAAVAHAVELEGSAFGPIETEVLCTALNEHLAISMLSGYLSTGAAELLPVERSDRDALFTVLDVLQRLVNTGAATGRPVDSLGLTTDLTLGNSDSVAIDVRASFHPKHLLLRPR